MKGWNIGNIQRQQLQGENHFLIWPSDQFSGTEKIYSIFFQLSLFVTAGSTSVVPFPIQYLLNIPRCNWFLSVSQERLKSSGNMVWRIQSAITDREQRNKNKLPNKGKIKCIQSSVQCLSVWCNQQLAYYIVTAQPSKARPNTHNEAPGTEVTRHCPWSPTTFT